MKRNYRKWSNRVLRGGTDFDAGNTEEAVQHYRHAMMLAEHLIDDTILAFDGDITPLGLYSYTCHCFVQLYIRTGDLAAARACLEQTGCKFMAILNNSGYPLLIRGKTIREFESLMNLTVAFFNAEGRPDESYTMIGDWLTEVKQYVSRMRPVAETVLMN